MSFQDWQAGLRAGLAQDVQPAVSRRDQEWYLACREIIARCVAPDMRLNALDMLERAMREASGVGIRVVSDPDVTADTAVVRDAKTGAELGRITNIGR